VGLDGLEVLRVLALMLKDLRLAAQKMESNESMPAKISLNIRLIRLHSIDLECLLIICAVMLLSHQTKCFLPCVYIIIYNTDVMYISHIYY
jgi:hypothetical protein